MTVTPLEWMRAVRDSDAFTAGTLNVLLMLGLRMRRDGTGFASQPQLAEDAGVSERTARRALREARDAGFVTQTRRGHRVTDGTTLASEYRLEIPTQPDTRDRLGEAPTGHPRPVGNRSQQDISEPNRPSVSTQPVTGVRPRGLHPEVLSPRVPLQGSGSTDVDHHPLDDELEERHPLDADGDVDCTRTWHIDKQGNAWRCDCTTATPDIDRTARGA